MNKVTQLNGKLVLVPTELDIARSEQKQLRAKVKAKPSLEELTRMIENILVRLEVLEK